MNSHSLLRHRIKAMMQSDKRAKLFSSTNKCLDDGILWSKDMLEDHYPC